MGWIERLVYLSTKWESGRGLPFAGLKMGAKEDKQDTRDRSQGLLASLNLDSRSPRRSCTIGTAWTQTPGTI